VFYKGKPAQKPLPSERGKSENVPLPVDLSKQGSIEESPEPKESPSSFWTITWIVCFIFPPFLLLAGPVYLMTRSSKGAYPSNKLNDYQADRKELTIPAPIMEAPPENEANDQQDVPWWEIDKLM
jgi:hypothetical protein